MCIFHKIAQELEVTKQGNLQLVKDAPTRMFVLPNRRDQTRVIMDFYTHIWFNKLSFKVYKKY